MKWVNKTNFRYYSILLTLVLWNLPFLFIGHVLRALHVILGVDPKFSALSLCFLHFLDLLFLRMPLCFLDCFWYNFAMVISWSKFLAMISYNLFSLAKTNSRSLHLYDVCIDYYCIRSLHLSWLLYPCRPHFQFVIRNMFLSFAVYRDVCGRLKNGYSVSVAPGGVFTVPRLPHACRGEVWGHCSLTYESISNKNFIPVEVFSVFLMGPVSWVWVML